MRVVGAIVLSVLICLTGSIGARASGPVTVQESAGRFVLENDYLQRTIEVREGSVATSAFKNKISGQLYSVHGDEFELSLNYEDLRYSFGGENPLKFTTRDFQVTGTRVADTGEGGKRLVFELEPKRPAIYLKNGQDVVSALTELKFSFKAALIFELKPDDFFMRKWFTLQNTNHQVYFVDSLAVEDNRWDARSFSQGGFGQPIFADDLFLGIEYPSGVNSIHDGQLTLRYVVGTDVPPGGFTSESAVTGVSAAGAVHRSFMDYIRRIRPVPVRPYLEYDTWYDLQRLVMNHDNTLQRVTELDQLLVKKFNLHLNTFTLDDGWDDMTNLWRIDRQRFPDGFHDLVSSLDKIHSRLGLWFGPVGGYDQRERRIETGRRQGMEITANGEFLCLAGRNYSRYFRDTLLRLQQEYNINYFMFDGIPFGCNELDHGHPVGIYSDAADLRTFTDLLTALRRQNPQIFLNITTGIWLSPWWVRYADSVWLGGDDWGYLDTVPALTLRQSSISYRDSVMYDDFVRHHVQFPMPSLYTEGVIKGKFEMLGGENESLDDWADHVINFVAVGNQFIDLLISPEILKTEEWNVLGHTIQWAIQNAHPLLDNSTFVLGDPAEREPYGYVHYSPEKTLIVLRNPFVRPALAKVKLDQQAGFEDVDTAYTAETLYPFRQVGPGLFRFGDTLDVELGAYEERVIQLLPSPSGVARIEGVRYAIGPSDGGGVVVSVYAPGGSTESVFLEKPSAYSEVRLDGEHVDFASHGDTAVLPIHFGKKASRVGDITYSVQPLRLESGEGTAQTLRVSLSVQIPADFQESKVAVLLEPVKEIAGIQVEGRMDGHPTATALKKGAEGSWYWFVTNVDPGTHNVDLGIHLPANIEGRARISGWLLAKRRLERRELRLSFKTSERLAPPPDNLLPASSEVERKTYALFDQQAP